jgi:hypothetical protein
MSSSIFKKKEEAQSKKRQSKGSYVNFDLVPHHSPLDQGQELLVQRQPRVCERPSKRPLDLVPPAAAGADALSFYVAHEL